MFLLGEAAQLMPVLPTLHENIVSKGLSLTGRSGEGLPGQTVSGAGTLLNLESCKGNVDVHMWGTQAVGAQEQAHGMAQTLPCPFLGSLWPLSVQETNINLLPCDKAHFDMAHSHPFSVPRAYHVLIYCGVGGLALHSCFILVDQTGKEVQGVKQGLGRGRATKRHTIIFISVDPD